MFVDGDGEGLTYDATNYHNLHYTYNNLKNVVTKVAYFELRPGDRILIHATCHILDIHVGIFVGMLNGVDGESYLAYQTPCDETIIVEFPFLPLHLVSPDVNCDLHLISPSSCISKVTALWYGRQSILMIH